MKAPATAAVGPARSAAAAPATPADVAPRPPRWAYLTLLNWAFALFSSTRLLTYLPTLWAIHTSADSSQHSLLTWSAWVASNATMAAWLFEHNGRRWNKAIVVTAGNAVMCGAACLLIVYYR